VCWSPARADSGAGATRAWFCSGLTGCAGVGSEQRAELEGRWGKSLGCGCVNRVLVPGKELMGEEERQGLPFHRAQSWPTWRDVRRCGCNSGVRCKEKGIHRIPHRGAGAALSSHTSVLLCLQTFHTLHVLISSVG